MANVLLHEWENRVLEPHTAAYAAARPLAVASLAARASAAAPRQPPRRRAGNGAHKIQLALTTFYTHDLRMELFSYGPEVEVLAPVARHRWLR